MRYGEFEFGAPVVGDPGRAPEVGEPVVGRACCGRAAKPGRTEPGRGPDIGGRSPGRSGRCAGGRGIAFAPDPKGLLPARGGRGITEGVDGAEGTEGVDAAGATGATGASGATGFSFLALVNCSRVDSGSDASAASISSGVGAAAFFAAVFLAAVFLATFGAGVAAFRSGNLSINLRTTGASTVDDAELTNSPTSCNLARSSLLSKPKSFANS